MINNNKILTVSYGTFSCTLEGFDDSFGTMKAIAEYFRGLSSDAPYFGAEPPQPDADMLARIAQKEISRRVEAREHEGKIHLSAIENRPDQEATAPQALLDDAADKDASSTIADTATAAAAVVVPAALSEPHTQDVAEETAREVEEVQSTEPEAETVIDDTAEADVAEVVAADEAPAIEAETATDDADEAVAAFVEDENDIVPGQPDADVEAFFANSADVPVVEDEDQDFAAEHVAPTSEALNPENDSIAAKLQRIRAVVAQHDETHDEEDFVEDQHADGAADEAAVSVTEPTHIMADARRDIEDALHADEAADSADHDVDAEDDEDDISAILGRLDAANAADAAEASDIDEDIVAVSQTSDATDDALSNLFEDDEDEVSAIDADDLELNTIPDEASDTIEDAADLDEPRTPRARVIKVKRADLEAAIEKGDLEEYVDDQEDAVLPSLDDLAPARSAETSLSAEDEAELARELADLAADMPPAKGAPSDLSASEDLDDVDDQSDIDDLNILDDYDEAEAFDDAAFADDDAYDDDAYEDEAQPASAASHHALPSIDDAQSDDMDRLLAETDQQMDEPESATRRNAFSHLRAAVAAKIADTAMGTSDKAEEDDNEYRNDLADVVRPRRPVSSATRTERPGEGRPAPLKLVAEQRIDVERARPAGPVRPRRVATIVESEHTAAPEGDSFADYAAEMGATKLPQLLEAAASYMSFVEGREQFSRPQLMTKVRQVGPEDGFSREDGLRSFGQLLRAGKIEKIKGGRFTVSEDIGYRPDHRAAG